MHYCLDLDHSLEILEFWDEDVQADLEYFGLSDPKELTTFDRKVFVQKSDAEEYVQKYLDALAFLEKNCRLNKLQNGKSMLLKRRYLVQVITGEKTQTRRKYKKNWEIGSNFNLYDQTFFVPAKLTALTQINDECFEYNFQPII